jgi:hypothetical protein
LVTSATYGIQLPLIERASDDTEKRNYQAKSMSYVRRREKEEEEEEILVKQDDYWHQLVKPV